MLMPQPSILILDAMGVIYQAGDDVADLLVPFVREKGGIADADEIDVAYLEASLGRIDAAEFWRRIGMTSDLEDDYLQRHTVTDCLLELLDQASDRYHQSLGNSRARGRLPDSLSKDSRVRVSLYEAFCRSRPGPAAPTRRAGR